MSSERTSAAVTISEEERRRLAAFKNILTGGQQLPEGHQPSDDAKNSRQPEHYSDDDEEDETLARQARAAWAQATPEKKLEKDEIWHNNSKDGSSATGNGNNNSSSASGVNGGGSSSASAKKAGRPSSPGAAGTTPEGKTGNAAFFSSQTTTSGWSNQNSTGGETATVNVVSPVRKSKTATTAENGGDSVNKPSIASRKSEEQKVSSAEVKLSVKARPFVPKQHSIEKTFSADQGTTTASAQIDGSTSPAGGGASSSSSSPQQGGRRQPKTTATTTTATSSTQPEGAIKARAPSSALASATVASTTTTTTTTATAVSNVAQQQDFLRWMGGAYRGPLQDPALALSSGFPLWMHLAVLPDQCGLPSAKRILRAWAIQFGLESVEYWTWRRLVIRGVRAPIDCTEPDVLGQQPIAEYLKGVLKWYDRLSQYKEVHSRVITDDERSLIERLATRSREEFLKYIKAYTPAAKAAFELMEKELNALECEAAKVEAERAKNTRVLGAGLTSGVGMVGAKSK